MENKSRHLELIQGVINRMASNSFMIKGWAITLVAALFVLANKDTNPTFFYIAYIPTIMFWVLDAYYLTIERRYRALYKEVCGKREEEIDFLMDTKRFRGWSKELRRNKWVVVMVWGTIPIFYVAMLATMSVVVCLSQNY
jgi:hypothetical protein